jgi:hypothetical protein
MRKMIVVAAIALLALSSTADARGRHGGGSHFGGAHHSSHIGSFHHTSVGSTRSYHSSKSVRANSGVHYTHPYVTKNGRYVRGHWATNKNKTHNDNFSTKGNRNPYTGKAGTKRPD